MNLLISKYQHLSETNSNQLNQSIRPQSAKNNHTPTYYYHRYLEQDRNVPLLTHQPQHHFYSSNYNQILPDAFLQNQSTADDYYQHFSPTQPTTSVLTQQHQSLNSNQSITTVTSDTLTHDFSQSTSRNILQRSPYDLSSTGTS